jgi:hypothetical protein
MTLAERSAVLSSVEESGTIPLVGALLAALEEHDIRYCHWKSTTGIAKALAGRTDLDLLVDREDGARFSEVAAGLGFKPFISHPSRRFPGVADMLGHDTATGRLVHLHIYHQLVLGEHYVKNHRLPIEAVVLASATLRNGIRVPSPEVEVAILAVRTLLKYRDVDLAKDRLGLGRRGGIPPDTRAELHDLRSRTTPESIRTTIERDLPMIPADVVLELLDLIDRDARDAAALSELRGRVRTALRRFERLPRRDAQVRYFRARTAKQWPIRPVLGVLSRSEARRKSPATGGVTVAIVGPDGAGKTTIIDSLTEWLAWRVNLVTLYLGSARPSRTGALARALARVGRRSHSGASRVAGADHPAARAVGGASTLLDALRAVSEARDRERRAARGWRLAAQGWLVIFDRYPLPGIQVGERAMDGPRIVPPDDGPLAGPIRRLAALERRAYERIPPPDHLVVLQVRPEVAVGRKAPRDPAVIAEKAAALLAFEPDGAPAGTVVHIVDAERPLHDVARDVRDIVWQEL